MEKNSITFREFILPEKDKKNRSTYGVPSAVLKIICKNKSTRKKSWRFSHLLRKMLGNTPEKSNIQISTSIKDACEQINTQILKKCGLENFLILDNDSVCINSLYLS